MFTMMNRCPKKLGVQTNTSPVQTKSVLVSFLESVPLLYVALFALQHLSKFHVTGFGEPEDSCTSCFAKSFHKTCSIQTTERSHHFIFSNSVILDQNTVMKRALTNE